MGESTSGDVVDIVLEQIGCVPGDGPVVGVAVEDSQAVVGGGGGDDEVHRRGAAMLHDSPGVVELKESPARGNLLRSL